MGCLRPGSVYTPSCMGIALPVRDADDLLTYAMNSQTVFILKVLMLSAGISVLIKYGCPVLSIPATPAIALTLVFLPTLLVAIALWWRSSMARSLN